MIVTDIDPNTLVRLKGLLKRAYYSLLHTPVNPVNLRVLNEVASVIGEPQREITERGPDWNRSSGYTIRYEVHPHD